MEQKLIDVKALKQKIMKTYLPSDSLTAGVLYDLISLAAPTVDAVKVVRCGECQKRNTPDCAMWYQCSICGGQWSWDTDNGFCSYGEPRTPPAE